MSKDRKKLQHIHSSVFDKQPTPATLELGELAVNNNQDGAFISTKNSNDEVVRFSEDDTVINWMEYKEVFPYSGYVGGYNGANGLTTQNLIENSSNLLFKINQVVPKNTVYHDLVNGAKDEFGNTISQISSDGERDGAGFYIDMSPYALTGGNPSFSSITTSCHAEFNGTTEIHGLDGSCGSALIVNDIDTICEEASDKASLYGANSTNVGINCDGSERSTLSRIYGDNVEIKGNSGITELDTSYSMASPKITIDASTSLSATSPTTDVSGNILNINEQATNISGSTLDITDCTHIYENTDDYKLEQCASGGSATVISDDVDITAKELDINSCDHIINTTDSFKVAECTEGQGETEITSGRKVKIQSDNVEISQFGESGMTVIKSCGEIRLESKNLIMSEGDCGKGEMTIEMSDLCLVGTDKINVYGAQTNVGLDCEDDNVASGTNIYGEDILISATTGSINQTSKNGNITQSANYIVSDATGTTHGINFMHADKYVQIKAGDVVESPFGGNGVNIKLDNEGDLSEFATRDICSQAVSSATFYGASATNIGISCDGSAITETTIVKGGKVAVHAADGNLGLTSVNDILESSEGDIIITSNNDICESAGNKVSVMGLNDTVIGVSCDGEMMSETTTIKGENLVIGGYDVCLDADDRATVYGANTSELGVSCDGESLSRYTNVKGNEIEIISTPVEHNTGNVTIGADGSVGISSYQNNVFIDAANGASIYGESKTLIGCDLGDDYTTDELALDANTSITIHCGEDINVQADEQYCLNANTVNIGGTQSVEIGKRCDDVISNFIEYYRTPDTQHSEISSTTVDKALDEVFDRSKVTVVPLPNPSGNSGETLITYRLYQDGQNIGDINLPKDHLIESASIVYGTVTTDGEGRQTFSACSGSDDCKWYIKMVWHTYDPTDPSSSGHTDSITYLEAESLVKDITSASTDSDRGVNVNVWYDSVSGMNLVSATTAVHVRRNNGNNDVEFERKNGEHYVSAYTLNVRSGDVRTASATNVTYDPFYQQEFLTIPTSFRHLIEFNGEGNNGCYQFNNDICMGDNTIVASAYYNTSDINLKENINSIDENVYNKVNDVEFKSFNFKDDEAKEKKYGVIAQDVQSAGLNELVHTAENGNLNVDYISLLILKLGSLENEVKQLKEELNNIKNKQ